MEKRQSVFMQMHNGTRGLEGSFNVALADLFYRADQSNRHKLVAAFPEFFGEELPEFGVHRDKPIGRNRPCCPCVTCDLTDEGCRAYLNARALNLGILGAVNPPSQGRCQAPGPEKSEQSPRLTIRHRVCHVERQEDGSLSCSACGRKLPLTTRGELDLEQLAREMRPPQR